MIYIVDANIFISTYKRDYPPSVFPTLWTHFSTLVVSGNLLTLDKVKAEVLQYQDECATFFTNTVPTTSVLNSNNFIAEYAEIISWAESENSHYRRSALDDFARNSAADAWIVAAALKLGHTILTQEASDPGNKKRVKVPDACIANNVAHCNFIDFLESTGYQG